VNVTLAARNILLVVWHRVAKWTRVTERRGRRGLKLVNEGVKEGRARLKHSREWVRDSGQDAYAGTVRATRTWNRAASRAWTGVSTELSARRELRQVTGGTHPIIVGPWLGEVGYEALYWVPFVRWVVDHYHVDRSRLVVVSRGGVASWYGDLADQYVELLDLFTPAEFAARNAERQARGDQKQLAHSAFDEEILARVRERLGRPDTAVCHPSTMFRLMRNFWLGTDSLQRVLDHTKYVRVTPAAGALEGLPDRFVAVKFYTGRALVDTPANRATLRALVEELARDQPVVVLNTALALDEHEDYLFTGVPNVLTLDRWLTPQNNLGVQTEVIRRASRFVGTCGSLAWLAPMLGTETLAIYADDYFLLPHLYAAGQIYPRMGAAPFLPLDLRALQALQHPEPAPARP
jgi:hypothetical protein